MKRIFVLITGGLLLFAAVNPAWAATPKLTDEEMDQITAGNFSLESTGGVTRLLFDSGAGPNKRVTGDGTITATSQSLPDAIPVILLQQGAQQDLHSLINIVAVNSQINVLLNLNISINSTVGNLTQLNFTAKP